MPFTVREGVPRVVPHQQVIGGLAVRIYGLDEHRSLPGGPGAACLAVIAHPRCRDYRYAETLAQELVFAVPRLVCAVFDLPNHGSRCVSPSVNEDWAGGNCTFGPDFVSIIDMAATEVAVIAKHLPAYIPELQHAAVDGQLKRVAIGVSLGGHVAWRIGVDPTLRPLFQGLAPILGCPDLEEMLIARWKEQSPGRGDIRRDIGPATQLALRVWEGRAALQAVRDDLPNQDPPIRILALCGGADRLVPASYTEEWAARLPESTPHRVFVQPNIKHETRPEMIDMLAEWLRTFFCKKQVK